MVEDDHNRIKEHVFKKNKDEETVEARYREKLTLQSKALSNVSTKKAQLEITPLQFSS